VQIHRTPHAPAGSNAFASPCKRPTPHIVHHNTDLTPHFGPKSAVSHRGQHGEGEGDGDGEGERENEATACSDPNDGGSSHADRFEPKDERTASTKVKATPLDQCVAPAHRANSSGSKQISCSSFNDGAGASSAAWFVAPSQEPKWGLSKFERAMKDGRESFHKATGNSMSQVDDRKDARSS
jgi:hypothetical protein